MNKEIETANDLRNEVFSAVVDIDCARAIIDQIRNCYFSTALTDGLIADITVRHDDIGLLLSEAVALLHDAISEFKKADIY